MPRHTVMYVILSEKKAGKLKCQSEWKAINNIMVTRNA